MSPSPERTIRVRAAVVYMGFTLFLGLVAARLVQLQVFPNPALKNLAAKQLHRTGKNAPYRMPIYDRNGEELAISVPASSVFARPRLVRGKKRTARLLSGMLGGSPDKWLKKLNVERPFVWLDRQVSSETARKIAARNLPGVFIEAENKRVYPNGNLAAHVLGFTDVDGNGLAGIELRLNEKLLEREPAYALVRDGRGKPSYVGRQVLSDGAEKKGIYLTIDRRIQNLLEEELEKTMSETHAQAAMGIILHPTTGEVLAMAQRPTFDPNAANKFRPEALQNRMIGHLLEPGSTVKVLFAAEAMELGLMKKDSVIDCEGGKFRIADKTFSEAHAGGFDKLSLEKVIRLSSNIGALKVSHALGAERTAATLEKFGLTAKTGIDLSGEAAAGQKPAKWWTPIHLATAGFGQGVSATPLQAVASYLPFANGGYWMRPKLVLENEPEGKSGMHRVISPKTAAIVRDIMVSVTEEKGGTGLRAKLPNVRVAGKTGTAQKYDREEGYQAGKYYSSFIGFLPAERPEMVIGVMVDEPSKEFYASEVAAPLFKGVAERALPLVRGQPGQAVTSFGEFAAGAAFPGDLAPAGDGQWLMPDLKGVSVRDAIKLMGSRLDRVKLSGTGYLSEQEPAAGELVKANTPVRLIFRPSG